MEIASRLARPTRSSGATVSYCGTNARSFRVWFAVVLELHKNRQWVYGRGCSQRSLDRHTRPPPMYTMHIVSTPISKYFTRYTNAFYMGLGFRVGNKNQYQYIACAHTTRMVSVRISRYLHRCIKIVYRGVWYLQCLSVDPRTCHTQK